MEDEYRLTQTAAVPRVRHGLEQPLGSSLAERKRSVGGLRPLGDGLWAAAGVADGAPWWCCGWWSGGATWPLAAAAGRRSLCFCGGR